MTVLWLRERANARLFLPAPATMTNAEKLNQGKRTIMVMDYWKNRSDVTLGQLHAIANWSLGEQASLDPSFVSRAIKGERGVSIADLIAFEALNHSLWTWQAEGSCWYPVISKPPTTS